MRRFYLYRDEDATGISGTGVIAEGVELKNGVAVLSWLTEHTSTAIYDSVKELILIHGHKGKTRLLFIDPTSQGIPTFLEEVSDLDYPEE